MGIRPEIVQESRHNATGLHGRRHGVSAPALVNCRAMRATLDPIRLNGGTILSDEVYARIGAAILDGTLPAGARLRDVELAEQLGVSRTPVREALQRLERFGLVEVAVGRYARVSEPSDRLREETVEFTAYFMGNALRIALQRCSDDQIAAIVEAADAVVAAARREDGLSLFEASTTMFQQVTRGTGNSVFIGFIREAALAIERNLRGWQPFIGCPIAPADGYQELRTCIAERDADGAERMLRHLHGLA